ncbi:MAG: hypothetical protein H6R07_3412 [Proteobacteria bacterium]|nr:hypothetical protein [Pseudomonadota bacterium]
MRGVILLGDKTSHGGTVVSASGHASVNGKQVARLGDKCTCPIKGHGNCSIAEGDSNVLVEGVPVAFDGHKTSCGAALISSTGSSGRG